MSRYVLMVLAPLLLGLGGCGVLQGAAGALGVQGITMLGQGTVRAIEQDIAAAQRWTGRHEAAVAIYMQTCLANAQRLAVNDWPAADVAFENCLINSVENMPTLLIERVGLRYKRSFGEEAAEAPVEEEGAAEATEPQIE